MAADRGGRNSRSERRAQALATRREPAACNQYSRQSGMESDRLHHPSGGGQLPVADRVEALEEPHGRLNRIRTRRFEPLKRVRIASPAKNVEYRRRQVDPVNVRFTMRPQPVARVPQSSDGAWPDAAGSAGALIRRVAQ